MRAALLSESSHGRLFDQLVVARCCSRCVVAGVFRGFLGWGGGYKMNVSEWTRGLGATGLVCPPASRMSRATPRMSRNTTRLCSCRQHNRQPKNMRGSSHPPTPPHNHPRAWLTPRNCSRCNGSLPVTAPAVTAVAAAITVGYLDWNRFAGHYAFLVPCRSAEAPSPPVVWVNAKAGHDKVLADQREVVPAGCGGEKRVSPRRRGDNGRL